MIRLDLSYFVRLGAQVGRLRHVEMDSTVSSNRLALNEARAWLMHLLQEQMFGTAGFRTAKHQIPKMLQKIDEFLARDDDARLDWNDTLELLGVLNQFETALLSEAAVADAYYVLEKPPYSTLSLATEGQTLFPPNTLAKVPEALADLKEAGRCIAFELPTAAAFHIHRATEAVLRRYWKATTGGAAKPKVRSIGVYLAALKKKKCGDSKVIAALSQLNELHRNPTIHPEDYLTLDEAIALLGMANSVVAAMLKAIPDAEPNQPELRLPIPPLVRTEPEHDIVP